MIPKIIHCIWLSGEKKMKFMRLAYQLGKNTCRNMKL